MRLPILSAALAAICLTLPATAQKVQVFGGNGMRANSSVILYGAELKAGITVTHGQPEWLDDYTDMLPKLKGKTNRLGKDLWTTFMTSVPITIGGTAVPAGSYVVGLHCDKQGNFSLAMLDATKAMKKGAMPFGPQNWKADVMTPLKLNKNVAKKSVAKMMMTLAADKMDPMSGTFTLAWGPHTLTGEMKVLPNMKKVKKDGEHGADHDGKHGADHAGGAPGGGK
ncbi:MAG: hypothetical protein ACI8UD_002991 [Planctomycetota bacterium]|jgi:hypothetical protein